MKKKLVPAICMALVSALCVGVSAAANPAPAYRLDPAGTPVVMTVNGENIYANEYAAYMVSAKMSYEAQMAQFGLDPAVVWNDPEMGKQFLDSVAENTKGMVTQYHAVLQKFRENGLQMNLNDKKELRGYRQNVITQMGGEEAYQAALQSQGLSDPMYQNSLLVSSYAKLLNDYYFGVNGILVPSEEDLRAGYSQHFIQAKHILFKLQDDSGAPLSAADAAKKKTLAEQVLKKAQAGEDFSALIAQYGEDPGMTANPDGYIFKEGDMVEEFYTAAKALKDNEISGLVESQFGYHIILRVPLDETKFADYKDALVGVVAGKDFPALLKEWTDGAKVTTVDEEIAKITMDNVLEIAMTGIPAAPVPTAPPADAPAADAEQPAADAEQPAADSPAQ